MDQANDLLRQFADEGSQAAFTELVRLKVDLVFAAALRQTGGDAHLAEDETQGVFAALATRAASLKRHPALVGWLFTTTRHFALRPTHKQRRWQRREQEAVTMSIHAKEETPVWDELRPVIDEAIHELAEKDRTALVLRFFEGRSLAEVGATIGLAENSARMRVERALEKLRVQLARRGITSTAAALGSALVAQPAVAAPAGLAGAVAGSVLKDFASVSASWAGKLLSLQNIVAVGAVSLAGVVLYARADAGLEARVAAEAQRQTQSLEETRSANAALRGENQRFVAEEAAQAEARAAAARVDPLDRLRAVVALIKEGSLGRVSWTGYAVDAEIVSPSLIHLFALTANEVRALAENLDRTRREISALAVAQATSQRHEREIIITVPAIAAARESYERLGTSLRQTVGAERFDLMTDIGFMSAVESWLDDFGLAPSMIRLWHVPAPRLPAYSYVLERERPIPGRPPAMRKAPGAPTLETHPGSMDLAVLKQSLGPFAAFVPEDF